MHTAAVCVDFLGAAEKMCIDLCYICNKLITYGDLVGSRQFKPGKKKDKKSMAPVKHILN